MKNTVKFALAVGLVAVGVAQSLAQDATNTPTTVTYSVQTLNAALTGFAQGGTGDNMTATPVRITTKDLVNVAVTTAGVTGTPRGAKIVIMTPTDNSAPSAFFLRTGSGKNTTDADVSGLFTGQTLLKVEKSSTNSKGVKKGTQYSIDTFQFGSTGDTGTPVSFNVQGFTQSTLGNGSMTSTVNGTGNINGSDAVLRGTIRAAGGRNETHTVAGG